MVLHVTVTFGTMRHDDDTIQCVWKVAVHLQKVLEVMSINFLLLSLDGLPLHSASNAEPVSHNFSIGLRTALR
jgi:hypothetical protein